jgi:4-hydroxybenzoate polyprenyltransferase
MLLLLVHLNRLAILTSLLYLCCGQAYNLGLKTTPAGGVVFALAIPLIPVYAFAAVDHIIPLIVWQVPVGVLLGLSIHLANTLPDIEQDTANHVRNIVVMLGRKRTVVAITILIMVAAGLVEVLSILGVVPVQKRLLFPTLVAVVALAGGLYLAFRSKQAHSAHQLYFYFIVLTCIVLFGGWAASALAG